jgi:internalin A
MPELAMSPRVALGLGLGLGAVLFVLPGAAAAQVAKDKKPAPLPKANPQQAAAAEKALTDFGCKLHRDDKAPGQPVDLVWFPPKTTDREMARLVPSAGRLPGLKSIDLGETKVTDAGIKELARLPNLEGVYLDKTAITDAGVSELAGLPRLAWLDLSRTKATAKSADTLAGMKSLRHLFLGAPLPTVDLAKIATLPRLQSLGIEAQKPDEAIKEVAKLTELTDLRFGGVPRGTAFAEFGKFGKVESLQLRDGLGLIAGDGWKVLADLPALRALDVSRFAQDDWQRYDRGPGGERGQKARPLPATADGLGGLTGLKKLDLTGNPIGDDALKTVVMHTGLEELSLTCTFVTLEGAKDLAGLTKLKRLRIRNAQVTNAGLRILEPLKGLEAIWLYDNKITEDGVNRLQKALPRTAIYWKYTKGGDNHRFRVPAGGYGG